MTTPHLPHCPDCGTRLTTEAPDGLCPACLMRQAMLPTVGGGSEEASGAAPALNRVAAAFPQWEVLDFIGCGGMGAVYKVRQPKLDRLAALKIIPATRAERDPAFAGRFEREGQLLARLHHPNIVTVHDSGRSGDFYYLLMEYADGVNLREAMQAGRFTPQQALTVVPKICEALQYAHGEGVLHRDIKPENILLDRKGRVKLADFGIAKLMHGTAAEDPGDLSGSGMAGALTQMGSAPGTPHYMAPEQAAQPQEVDHRADIYSLGVVFYELLTGELPAASFAPPSQLAGVDRRIDAIVRQALEKERDLRQRSAAEMKTQVEAVTAIPSPAPSVHTPVPGGKTKVPWQRWLGLGLMTGSVPFVVLSFIWLYLMSQERGSWNPAPAEALVVSASWVIALLLLGPGVVVYWKSRHLPGKGRRAAWGWLLVPLAAAVAYLSYHRADVWVIRYADSPVSDAAAQAVINQARDESELTQKRYEAGMSNYLEVIDARYALELAEAAGHAEKKIAARHRWAVERVGLLQSRYEAGVESEVDLEKAKLERDQAEAEWKALKQGRR